MMNRVTEGMKFSLLQESVNNHQTKLGKVEEQIATQKAVNRPSDDPVGVKNILDLRSAKAAVMQYEASLTSADLSLSIAETALASLRGLVAEAKTIAASQCGAGASPENTETLAASVKILIDEALSLMNTRQEDMYLFAGSRSETPPFSAAYQPAHAGAVQTVATNVFNGTATAGGQFSGDRNRTYALKIIEGGALADAAYRISADGGQTWGNLQSDLSLPISLGDGISMTFSAGTEDAAAGDLFYVDGFAGGYYSGNDGELTMQVAKSTRFVYNVSGFDAFCGPTALATVEAGQESSLSVDDTVVLTRTSGGWSLTAHPGYPGMAIVSQSATALNIDADGDSVADFILSLSGEWTEGSTATFAITAGAAPALGRVSVAGTKKVDLLGTLWALQDSLKTNNIRLVGEQVERLEALETQLLQSETLAGAKRESLKITGGSHQTMKLQLTNRLDDVETADLTRLILDFQMRQIAMEASYNMAAKISQMTILDYI
jgi:flagellar hook-associated protein 3 FlgL